MWGGGEGGHKERGRTEEEEGKDNEVTLQHTGTDYHQDNHMGTDGHKNSSQPMLCLGTVFPILSKVHVYI